jgi:predicted  nucleic acid-binding Zn-ribbon protein
MAQILEELHRLQEVELKLAVLRRTHEGKARRVELCRKRVRQADERLEQDQRTIRERQAKLDSLGLDVAVREEAIGKHRQALAKAKTNKEYAAILTAMNTEKADNTKIESVMLELMEEIQTLRDARARLEAERGKLVADVDAATGVLERYEAECRGQREALEARRDEHAARIPASSLNLFLRAAQKHDGEAMAAVRKIHPKRDDYVCSGCNMNLTLEIINALHTRDELQFCGACGRILHMAEAETTRR